MPRRSGSRSKSRGRKEKENKDIRLFVNTEQEGATKRKLAQRSPQVLDDSKKERKGDQKEEERGAHSSDLNLVVPWNKAKSIDVDKKVSKSNVGKGKGHTKEIKAKEMDNKVERNNKSTSEANQKEDNRIEGEMKAGKREQKKKDGKDIQEKQDKGSKTGGGDGRIQRMDEGSKYNEMNRDRQTTEKSEHSKKGTENGIDKRAEEVEMARVTRMNKHGVVTEDMGRRSMNEVNKMDGVLVKMNLIKLDPEAKDANNNQKDEDREDNDMKQTEEGTAKKDEIMEEETKERGEVTQTNTISDETKNCKQSQKDTQTVATASGVQEQYNQIEEEDYGLTSNDESTVVQKEGREYIDYDKVMTGQQPLPPPKQVNSKYTEQFIEIDDKSSEEGERNDNVRTVEDDENTIQSGETTKLGKKEQSRIVLPALVRFQITILLDQEDEEQEETKEEKSAVERFTEVLQTLSKQIFQSDNQAQLISWRTDNNFTYMPKDKFPEEVVEIAKYFPGFKKVLKPNRRSYFRFAVHTPNNFKVIEKTIGDWSRLYSYSFKRCLIQSENESYIGWLAYSNVYTDFGPLRKQLQERTGFEWGFKPIPIAEDKQKKWFQRAKALGVYVPESMEDIAKMEIAAYLEADDTCASPEFKDMYLFVKKEDKDGSPNYYSEMVERHTLHIDSTEAKVSMFVKVDLDRKIWSNKGSYVTTLREIILSIHIKDKSNPLFGSPMFNTVDYVQDNSNMWVNNKPCSGGPCVIFTFYKKAKEEARTMIDGLGRYVARIHGTNTASPLFKAQHFRATKGWRYRPSLGLFETPHERQKQANLEKDRKKYALDIIRTLNEEEKRQQASEVVALTDIFSNAQGFNQGEQLEEREDVGTQSEDRDNPNNNINNNNNNTSTNQNQQEGLSLTRTNTTVPQQSNNIQHDQMAENGEQRNMEIENQQRHNEHSAQSSLTSGFTNLTENVMDNQLRNLIQSRKDTDMDSIQQPGQKKKEVHDIRDSDQVSVASSLTISSIESGNSDFSDFTQNSTETEGSNSRNTNKMINLAAIANNDMTDEQVKERSKADFKHKMVRLELMREAAVEKYIAERNEKESQRQQQITGQEKAQLDSEATQSSQDSIVTPKRGKNKKDKKKIDNDQDNKKMPASSNNAGNQQ